MKENEVPVIRESNGDSYHFYLYDTIGPPSEYVEMIHLIESANPNDILYIHLNTPGGDLYSTVNIIQAIKSSEATVVTCADGLVSSGGSLIFFCGSAMRIGDHCSLLIHDGDCGVGGKISENVASIKASSKLLRKVYEDVYTPYLSQEELDEVLGGKDLWLDSQEVGDRIQKVIDSGEKEDE